MVGGPGACIVHPHSKPWAVRFTSTHNLHADGPFFQYGTSCGGTLISKNLVLTAAHCRICDAHDSPARCGPISAMVGEHDVEDRNDQQIIGIERELVYPNYKGAKIFYTFLIKGK